jgi:hypothetical protein
MFLKQTYPVERVELQISFDFPEAHSYDFYAIQWVESDRDLMIGWHQDETHTDLGECHFQIDYQNEIVQRSEAEFLDMHPLNVLDRRLDDFGAILDALRWEDGVPSLPDDAIR